VELRDPDGPASDKQLWTLNRHRLLPLALERSGGHTVSKRVAHELIDELKRNLPFNARARAR
jgi:hypothetical protein